MEKRIEEGEKNQLSRASKRIFGSNPHPQAK
jgi:hypothetical protein